MGELELTSLTVQRADSSHAYSLVEFGHCPAENSQTVSSFHYHSPLLFCSLIPIYVFVHKVLRENKSFVSRHNPVIITLKSLELLNVSLF